MNSEIVLVDLTADPARLVYADGAIELIEDRAEAREAAVSLLRCGWIERRDGAA